MRYALLAVAASLIPLSASAAGGDFPYEAIVSAEEADVLAGPGRRYYATARLARGERVEVYRRELGGWLAIRPPAESFSWIPASQLKITTPPDIAETVEDGVPSWIGSRVQKVREHKSHIALDRGETVQILGEKKVTSDEGEEETWYKIAPPTGEFRFIHHRDVSRVLPPEDQPPPPPTRPTPPALAREAEPLPEEGSAEEAEATDTPGEPARFAAVKPREAKPLPKLRSNIAFVDLFQPAPQPAKFTPVGENEVVPAAAESSPAPKELPKPKGPGGDGFQPRKARQTNVSSTPLDRLRPKEEPANRIASVPTGGIKPLPAPPAATTKPPPPKSTVEPSVFKRRLEELELELSAMVAGPPATWRLSDLRQRVELLAEDGPTPADRGQARLLLDRIHKFAQSFDVDDDPVRSLLPGTPVANAAVKPLPEAMKSPSAAAVADPKYDGQGWLREVLARDKKAAPFAIVDDEGKTIAFVSPAPGLNLNRYEGKKVGVYGQRGVIESLKTPHIVAQRVIDLERHLK